MALATPDKRRLLEDAWDLTVQTKLKLRDQLRVAEKDLGAALAGGSLSSVSANGRNSQWSQSSSGNITQSEVAQGYRELIDLYDSSAKWIRICCKYGFDAFNSEITGLPSSRVVQDPQVIVDDTTKWEEACAIFSVRSIAGLSLDAEGVIDDSAFIWMMDHLFAVTESRSDFSQLLVAAGWTTGGYY